MRRYEGNDNHQVRQYKAMLEQNLERLVAFQSDQGALEYPKLKKWLTRYNDAKLNKLIALHRYFIEYSLQPSASAYRGVEMMASLDALVKHTGGSKESWRKTLNQFQVLELLQCFKPRKSRPQMTEAQEYSVALARKQGHEKPVTWYHIPKYTPEALKRTEGLTGPLEALGTTITKDSVRDLFGEEHANRAFDSGYDIGTWTGEYRAALETALTSLLDRQGYAYPDDVLREAKQDTERIPSLLDTPKNTDMFLEGMEPLNGRVTRAIEREWKAYRPILLGRMQCKYGRPTAEQVEQLGLSSKQYIITRTCQ